MKLMDAKVSPMAITIISSSSENPRCSLNVMTLFTKGACCRKRSALHRPNLSLRSLSTGSIVDNNLTLAIFIASSFIVGTLGVNVKVLRCHVGLAVGAWRVVTQVSTLGAAAVAAGRPRSSDLGNLFAELVRLYDGG